MRSSRLFSSWRTILAVLCSASIIQGQPQLVVENDWGTGWQGRIEVRNSSSTTLQDWRVDFRFSGQITSMWNATPVSTAAGQWTVAAPSWAKALAPGAAASFGFIAQPGGTLAGKLEGLVLRDAASSGPAPQPAPAPDPEPESEPDPEPTPTPAPEPSPAPSGVFQVGDIRITFTVASSWGTAAEWHGSLTNHGGQPIRDWRLTFPLPGSIASAWDARVAKTSPSEATATPETWNRDLAPGATIAFGFITSPGNTSLPASISWNGSVVSNPTPTPDPEPEPTPNPEPQPTPEPEPEPTPGPSPAPANRPLIVAYFAEWGIYDRNYTVENIPAAHVDVINYAFAQIVNGEVAIFDSWAAVEKPFGPDTWETPLRGNYGALLRLKSAYPHLKTLISVGGWTLSGPFSDVAATAAGREKFARSALGFIRTYGFDGVDIDWEYPGGGGLAAGRPEDTANFTLLLQELRRQLDAGAAFDGKSYWLTIAAPAGPHTIANLDIPGIGNAVDWINIMTYDFHGSWENVTGHNAPLRGRDAGDPLSVENATAAYRSAGIPGDQLVVGVPFYGRAWRGVGATADGLYQPAAGPAPGPYEGGMIDYRHIVERVAAAPAVWKRFWDATSQVPYLYAPTYDGGTWVTYDDPESIRLKAAWIRAQGLRGGMLWELSGDIRTGGSGSLLGTLRSTLDQP